MWFKDFPEHDPDSLYAEPSVEQIACADEVERTARASAHRGIADRRLVERAARSVEAYRANNALTTITTHHIAM